LGSIAACLLRAGVARAVATTKTSEPNLSLSSQAMSGSPEKQAAVIQNTPDTMMRMQLSAIGMSSWLPRARCCGCIPTSIGGLLICLWLILCGAVAILETMDVLHIAFRRYDSQNPFVNIAMFLYFMQGIGDFTAGIIAFIGILGHRPMVVLGFIAWLGVRCFLGFYVMLVIAAFNTMNVHSLGMLFFFFLMAVISLYCIFQTLEVLLSVTLHGTVDEPVLHVLDWAHARARESGSSTVQKDHIIEVLLQDHLYKNRLEQFGFGARNLESGKPYGGRAVQSPSSARMVMGHDSLAMVAAAAWIQREVCAKKLTVDHLCSAIAGKRPEEHAQLNIKETEELPEGPPGASIFGCLPLEETLIAYVILMMVIDFLSLCCLVFLDRGFGALLGLRTVGEMRNVEFFSSLIGLVLGCWGLYGIFQHRTARWAIKCAAYRLPRSPHSWENGLDDAFSKVRSTPDGAKWLKMLKGGTRSFGAFFVWSVVGLFLDIPIYGMAIVVGNVCGFYTHGIANVARLGLYHGGVSPLRCTHSDVMLLWWVGIWMALSVYMCWAMLALWHQFAYGWTCTDIRGAAYLDPISVFSQDAIGALATFPGWAEHPVRLVSNIVRVVKWRMGFSEAKPILH